MVAARGEAWEATSAGNGRLLHVAQTEVKRTFSLSLPVRRVREPMLTDADSRSACCYSRAPSKLGSTVSTGPVPRGLWLCFALVSLVRGFSEPITEARKTASAHPHDLLLLPSPSSSVPSHPGLRL
jgi:hypothetical protein